MKEKYHKRLRKILESKWGFSELKDKQMEIIETLINDKKDVVGLLPTGFGKSMTFLIPPLITIQSKAAKTPPVTTLGILNVSFMTTAILLICGIFPVPKHIKRRQIENSIANHLILRPFSM